MKTLLILVDDAYAETLKKQLPGDKAWILETRYDTFRCRLHQALEDYGETPDGFEPYHKTIAETDTWFSDGAGQ